jgi:RHS repeat-associated protein
VYEFDARGNLAARGNDQFQYDSLGQLLEVNLEDGVVITYGYDAMARRVSRTDSDGTEQYLYGDPEKLQRITNVRHADGSLDTLYYTDHDTLFAFDRDGSRFYVITDQVGSVRMVADSSGQVVRRLSYDSYGRVLSDSNPDFAIPFGFAGGLQDPDTGLVHFGWRDYEPESGRWTSRDPLLFHGGQVNLYIYVGNNPVTYFDILGLFSFGMSGYDGIGGGFKISFTSEGFSTCFELGIGFGTNISLDPNGKLDRSSVGGVAGVSAHVGPLGVGLENTVDDCGSRFKASASYGPISYDTDSGLTASGKIEDLGESMTTLLSDTSAGAQGRAAVQVCTRWF